MSILNQQFEFSQLPDNVQRAFLSVTGSKVLLPYGTALFRFSGRTHISPWWSEGSDLPKVLLSALASRQSLFEYIRKTTAVLRQWDPEMHNLIIAKLIRPVYAFRGTISPQNEAHAYMNPADLTKYKSRFTKPVFFGGGNSQVYINGLSDQDVNIVVPAGTINIYDKVDDIIDFLSSYKII